MGRTHCNESEANEAEPLHAIDMVSETKYHVGEGGGYVMNGQVESFAILTNIVLRLLNPVRILNVHHSSFNCHVATRGRKSRTGIARNRRSKRLVSEVSGYRNGSFSADNLGSSQASLIKRHTHCQDIPTWLLPIVIRAATRPVGKSEFGPRWNYVHHSVPVIASYLSLGEFCDETTTSAMRASCWNQGTVETIETVTLRRHDGFPENETGSTSRLLPDARFFISLKVRENESGDDDIITTRFESRQSILVNEIGRTRQIQTTYNVIEKEPKHRPCMCFVFLLEFLTEDE